MMENIYAFKELEGFSLYPRDNYYILEKPVKNLEEETKLYNPYVLARLGITNAEVVLVDGDNATDQNQESSSELQIQTGGYYNNVEELTWPFRQFVYLVQSNDQHQSTSEPTKYANPINGSFSIYTQIQNAFSNLSVPSANMNNVAMPAFGNLFAKSAPEPVQPGNGEESTAKQFSIMESLGVHPTEIAEPLTAPEQSNKEEKEDGKQEENQPTPFSIMDSLELHPTELPETSAHAETTQTPKRWQIRIPQMNNMELIPYNTFELARIKVEQTEILNELYPSNSQQNYIPCLVGTREYKLQQHMHIVNSLSPIVDNTEPKANAAAAEESVETIEPRA